MPFKHLRIKNGTIVWDHSYPSGLAYDQRKKIKSIVSHEFIFFK
jgi:hypothetical protein